MCCGRVANFSPSFVYRGKKEEMACCLASSCLDCLTSPAFLCVKFFVVRMQVVAVYGTIVDLLSVASSKLGIRASNIYNGKGGLIDDIALVR